jgi:peptidoglycan/LPS O-acetylase OafA/YrhL
LRVIYCFFAGVAIFRVRSVVRLPALPAWLAVAAFVAIIAVPAPDELRRFYNAFAATLLFPLLVALAAQSHVSGLAARVCAVLGTLSYGVYVLQTPVIRIMYLAFDHIGIATTGSMHAIAAALVCAMLAALAYQFYDVPLRRWLSRRAAPNAPARAI